MKRLAIAALFAVWLGGTGFARAEDLTLLFGTSTPPGTHISIRVFHPWAERINEQGKGIVKIDVRDGMEIANPGNFYTRVRDDVIQIGWGSHNSVPGTFPLSGFSNLPFQTESSETSSVAFWGLIKAGYFDAEYKDVVPLFVQIYPQSQVHLAKAPKSPDDIGGLRLMVVAKTNADVATRLGAAPIFLLLPELFRPATQYGRRRADVVDRFPALQARRGHDLSHRHGARHAAGDGVHGQKASRSALARSTQDHRPEFGRG